MNSAIELKARRIVASDKISGIEALAVSATIILALAFIMALMSRLHWTFDLFSNFMLQYLIASLALAFILGLYGQWIGACACFLIFAFSLYHLNPRPLAIPSPPLPGQHQIEVLHFNNFHNNAETGRFMQWVQNQNTPPDVVILQEVTARGFEQFEALRPLYPYRFPETAQNLPRIYILSRHPITKARMINTATAEQDGSLGLQTDILFNEDLPPVSVYSLHAHRPLSMAGHARRNHELERMAAAIAENETPYKIFAGDWNITPYSPYFKDLLKNAKLNHTYYGLNAPGTWPSFMWPAFMRLPVDHILHSEAMKMDMMNTGPSFSSDHNPICARFTIRETAAKIAG